MMTAADQMGKFKALFDYFSSITTVIDGEKFSSFKAMLQAALNAISLEQFILTNWHQDDLLQGPLDGDADLSSDTLDDDGLYFHPVHADETFTHHLRH